MTCNRLSMKYLNFPTFQIPWWMTPTTITSRRTALIQIKLPFPLCRRMVYLLPLKAGINNFHTKTETINVKLFHLNDLICNCGVKLIIFYLFLLEPYFFLIYFLSHKFLLLIDICNKYWIFLIECMNHSFPKCFLLYLLLKNEKKKAWTN